MTLFELFDLPPFTVNVAHFQNYSASYVVRLMSHQSTPGPGRDRESILSRILNIGGQVKGATARTQTVGCLLTAHGCKIRDQ